MHPKSTKKQYERYLLDAFLAAAKIDVEVLDDVNEAPDVIVRAGDSFVGVEITELFTQPARNEGAISLQGRESIARKVVDRASEIYRASGAPHAYVSVHFSPSSDLRRLNRDETARRLANFVAQLALSSEQHTQWRQDYASGALPDAITFVNMLGVPENSMAHWAAPSAGWVSPMTSELLQARVDEKARLLPKYRTRVKDNWLLLVSDGAKPSQFFDLPTHELARSIVSPFERTFYLARFKGTVIELGAPDELRPTLPSSGRPAFCAGFQSPLMLKVSPLTQAVNHSHGPETDAA